MAAKYFDQKELAALVLNVAITNAFNRLNEPTRQQAGKSSRQADEKRRHCSE